jgi:hypothetical protein
MICPTADVLLGAFHNFAFVSQYPCTLVRFLDSYKAREFAHVLNFYRILKPHTHPQPNGVDFVG